MSLDTTALTADLAEMFADLTQTFTIGATPYSCAAGEAARGMDPEDAGIWPEADLEIVAAANAAFVAGVKLTFGGKSYRIQRVARSQDSVSDRLFCRADDRKGGG